jgi:hypothetical protein
LGAVKRLDERFVDLLTPRPAEARRIAKVAKDGVQME